MFILVYRLAMDAKTRKGDGGAGGKYPSLLEDFQTGTASMARKRHLHQAQGVFIVFVLWPHKSTLMRTHPLAYCPIHVIKPMKNLLAKTIL